MTSCGCRTFTYMKQIFPQIIFFSISSQETQCVSFTQFVPSPWLTFSKPGIQNMCFQSALSKTLCLTQSPPTCKHFKHSKLQNKKMRLSASALPPHCFSRESSQSELKRLSQLFPTGNDARPLHSDLTTATPSLCVLNDKT